MKWSRKRWRENGSVQFECNKCVKYRCEPISTYLDAKRVYISVYRKEIPIKTSRTYQYFKGR